MIESSNEKDKNSFRPKNLENISSPSITKSSGWAENSAGSNSYSSVTYPKSRSSSIDSDQGLLLKYQTSTNRMQTNSIGEFPMPIMKSKPDVRSVMKVGSKLLSGEGTPEDQLSHKGLHSPKKALLQSPIPHPNDFLNLPTPNNNQYLPNFNTSRSNFNRMFNFSEGEINECFNSSIGNLSFNSSWRSKSGQVSPFLRSSSIDHFNNYSPRYSDGPLVPPLIPVSSPHGIKSKSGNVMASINQSGGSIREQVNGNQLSATNEIISRQSGNNQKTFWEPKLKYPGNTVTSSNSMVDLMDGSLSQSPSDSNSIGNIKNSLAFPSSLNNIDQSPISPLSPLSPPMSSVSTQESIENPQYVKQPAMNSSQHNYRRSALGIYEQKSSKFDNAKVKNVNKPTNEIPSSFSLNRNSANASPMVQSVINQKTDASTNLETPTSSSSSSYFTNSDNQYRRNSSGDLDISDITIKKDGMKAPYNQEAMKNLQSIACSGEAASSSSVNDFRDSKNSNSSQSSSQILNPLSSVTGGVVSSPPTPIQSPFQRYFNFSSPNGGPISPFTQHSLTTPLTPSLQDGNYVNSPDSFNLSFSATTAVMPHSGATKFNSLNIPLTNNPYSKQTPNFGHSTNNNFNLVNSFQFQNDQRQNNPWSMEEKSLVFDIHNSFDTDNKDKAGNKRKSQHMKNVNAKITNKNKKIKISSSEYWHQIRNFVPHKNLEDAKELLKVTKQTPVKGKGSWTKEEDTILKQKIAELGMKWSRVASFLPGRVGKQVRERYLNHLDPRLKKGAAWTDEEEKTLIEGQKTYHNKWTSISKLLPGRSDNDVKNHWYSCIQRKIKNNEIVL